MKTQDMIILARHKFGPNAIVEIETVYQEGIGSNSMPPSAEPSDYIWAGKYNVCKVGIVEESVKVWLGTGSDWEQAFEGAEKAVPVIDIVEEVPEEHFKRIPLKKREVKGARKHGK